MKLGVFSVSEVDTSQLMQRLAYNFRCCKHVRKLGLDVDRPQRGAQAHAVREEVRADGGDENVGLVAAGGGGCGRR